MGPLVLLIVLIMKTTCPFSLYLVRCSSKLGGFRYYIVDHSCHKVIKLDPGGDVTMAAAFKHTYEKYLAEFMNSKYDSTTWLEILVVTGWSEERIRDFIGSFRTSEYCEGTVWPLTFEEEDEDATSTGLWDPDAESPWL